MKEREKPRIKGKRQKDKSTKKYHTVNLWYHFNLRQTGKSSRSKRSSCSASLVVHERWKKSGVEITKMKDNSW